MSVRQKVTEQFGVPGPDVSEVERKFYPGISKESMWETAREDEELASMIDRDRAFDRFRYSMTELELDCTVNLNSGQITVHSVNGVDLAEGLTL